MLYPLYSVISSTAVHVLPYKSIWRNTAKSIEFHYNIIIILWTPPIHTGFWKIVKNLQAKTFWKLCKRCNVNNVYEVNNSLIPLTRAYTINAYNSVSQSFATMDRIEIFWWVVDYLNILNLFSLNKKMIKLLKRNKKKKIGDLLSNTVGTTFMVYLVV